MRVDVLGPLKLTSGGAEVPPASARNSLQVHVSNLRKVLEPARERSARPAVLVSAAPGYGLLEDEVGLDVRDLDRRLTSGPGTELRKRVRDEAARRGQPVPVVHRPAASSSEPSSALSSSRS